MDNLEFHNYLMVAEQTEDRLRYFHQPLDKPHKKEEVYLLQTMGDKRPYIILNELIKVNNLTSSFHLFGSIKLYEVTLDNVRLIWHFNPPLDIIHSKNKLK